jgi:hypothetical protein
VPANRFVLAQSWWLASRLVRRHPELDLIETHPGGGLYDCLTLVRDGHTVVDVNRAGSIHVPGAEGFTPIPTASLLDCEEPAEIVARIETAAGLRSPVRAPRSTPAVLTFRTIAHLMAVTVDDGRRWDVRNEYLDVDGTGSPPGALAGFPVAAERARQRRPDGHRGAWGRRFWGVSRDEEVVAVVETDGSVHVGRQVLDLPTLYQASNRRLTATVAAALGTILP